MKTIKEQRELLAKKEDYTSLFDGKIKIANVEYDKKICRWSEWKHLPAEEMLVHVREDIVFPFPEKST
jgi:type I restriction enzyme M protein